MLNLERFEDVALEIEVAGYVRPAEPELARWWPIVETRPAT
jgi:hypothetical protein